MATRPGNYTKKDRNKMLLSQETLEGLQITGRQFLPYIYILNSCFAITSVHSVVEVARFLFNTVKIKVLFTERFCQDPLESFFGQQRQSCGGSDNPNVDRFLHNTVSYRIQGSTAMKCKRGNCHQKETKDPVEIDETPLPKRPRHSYSNKSVL